MSLARHSMLNVAGSAVPLLVSLPAIGLLARTLDTERFALVLLAWALVGFAGVLDLGLSRAVVLQVARLRGNTAAQACALRSAVVSVTLLGVLAAVGVFLGREWLVDSLLKVSPAVRDDAVRGFAWVALSIVLLMPTMVLHGFWDGIEDFAESNLQRAIAGALVPLACVAGTLLAPQFGAAMAALLVARAIALVLALVRGGMLARLGTGTWRRSDVAALLRYGGWITVSNTVSPVMTTLDRYILSYMRGAAVTGFYAAPVDAASKLLVLPVAVTRSLFPKLVVIGDGPARRQLLRQSRGLIAIGCLPLATAVALLAPWVLATWLGELYAEQSTDALRILMLGFLFGAFAQVPFTDIQARGRAEVTAGVHLLEVGPFLAVAFWLSGTWGVEGAALAWSLRNLVDLALLTLVARALTAKPLRP